MQASDFAESGQPGYPVWELESHLCRWHQSTISAVGENADETRTSALPKGPHHLIPQRFEEIGEYRAAFGLYKGFDGHARDDLEAAKTRQFCVRHSDMRSVIRG